MLCILGKYYAYVSIKTVIATILKSYVIEADGTLDDIQLKTDISVRTIDHRYPIRLNHR